MQIVVTGAAGFIGSHLSEALVAQGHTVIGIDALTGAYSRERKLANLKGLRRHSRFSLHVADVSEPASVTPLIRGCDAVCHLAGLGGARGGDERACRIANVNTTRAVVDAATSLGVPRVVLASSSSVYGQSPGPWREDSELAPISPYGRSKLEAEEVARGRSALGETALVVLRYFTVYGPRQRPDMAFARYIDATFAREVMPRFGDGSQRRDFTFVVDVVAGTISALESGRAAGTYNLSGGQSVSLDKAFTHLHALLGDGPVAVSEVPEPGSRGRLHRSRSDACAGGARVLAADGARRRSR